MYIAEHPKLFCNYGRIEFFFYNKFTIRSKIKDDTTSESDRIIALFHKCYLTDNSAPHANYKTQSKTMPRKHLNTESAGCPA